MTRPADDSNLDGALLGGAAAAALPLASTVQYAGYDLPRYLRQADRMADALPLISSGAANEIAKLIRPGRVVLQGTEPVGMRQILAAFLDGRRRMSPLREPGIAGLWQMLRRNADLARNVWEDKFELGYGSTATSGTPFRHAVMMDSKGQMLDGHATTAGGPKAVKAHDAQVAKDMQSKSKQQAHSKSYHKGVGSNTVWVQKWDQPSAFSLLGDFNTPDMGKTMAAAYTSSASNYSHSMAKNVGIRHVLAPRLPAGKARERAIKCRGGYCSLQAEDSFGLRNILGGKDALPSHLALRGDFKPVALVTSGISGSKVERIAKLRDLWKGGIKTNAKRRIGLGLLASLGAFLPGALVGGGADALASSKPRGVGLAANKAQ